MRRAQQGRRTEGGQGVAAAGTGALGSSAASSPTFSSSFLSLPHTFPFSTFPEPWSRPGAFHQTSPARGVVIVLPTMSVLNKQMFIVNP